MTGEQLEQYLRQAEERPTDDETARPSPLPPDLDDAPEEETK